MHLLYPDDAMQVAGRYPCNCRKIYYFGNAACHVTKSPLYYHHYYCKIWPFVSATRGLANKQSDSEIIMPHHKIDIEIKRTWASKFWETSNNRPYSSKVTEIEHRTSSCQGNLWANCRVRITDCGWDEHALWTDSATWLWPQGNLTELS